MQLIHLFGDPLLRIKRPEKIRLFVDEVVASGETLKISGVSPATGEMTVELVYRRDRFRKRPPYRREYDSSDEAFQAYQEVYENSHQLTCSSKTIFVGKGTFETEIPVPASAGGRCTIRCMLNSPHNFALGACPIEVRKKVRDSEAKR